ncbi:MAG: hypothetical protein ACMUEL_04560 [Flavobacteriales bacterium Tduv]
MDMERFVTGLARVHAQYLMEEAMVHNLYRILVLLCTVHKNRYN